MADGIVTWFDPRRGFGFISRAGFVSRDAGGAEIFVHRSQVDTASTLDVGDRVRFTLELHPKGLHAVAVHAV
jgi:CspA family cold shock protein